SSSSFQSNPAIRWISSYAQESSTGAGLTRFLTLGHAANFVSVTESAEQIIQVSSGVASKMYCRIISNDRGDSTLTFRINGGNGNLTISIPSSTTGELEDNVNKDTINSGDKTCYRLITGSGGTTFKITITAFNFLADTN